jgi:hypothetical protein
MVDFTATQAQAKGATPSAHRERGQIGTAVTKTPSALPSPTTDGVDRMYRQLAEIHAITVVQLAECARWRRSAGACRRALGGNDSTTTTTN